MAQNEMPGSRAATPQARTWRLDLNRLTLWQGAALVLLGFMVGAGLGLVFS